MRIIFGDNPTTSESLIGRYRLSGVDIFYEIIIINFENYFRRQSDDKWVFNWPISSVGCRYMLRDYNQFWELFSATTSEFLIDRYRLSGVDISTRLWSILRIIFGDNPTISESLIGRCRLPGKDVFNENSVIFKNYFFGKNPTKMSLKLTLFTALKKILI